MRVALASLWTLSDMAPDALGALSKVLALVPGSASSLLEFLAAGVITS